MTTVTAEREIDVPVNIAYDQWAQFESFPNFLSGVLATTQADDHRVHWRVKVGGVEREFDTEIVRQEPNKLIAWRSVAGPIHTGSVRFTPVGTRTKILLELDWVPEGFVEKAGAALGIDNLQVERDLKRFAVFVEHRRSPSGAWPGGA